MSAFTNVMIRKLWAVTAALLLLATASIAEEKAESKDATNPFQLKVETSFHNGSGDVALIDQRARHIKLQPSRREGRGWECWWYISVSGIRPGETITLEVGRAPWATPLRACYSVDNSTWRQTEPGQSHGLWMTYRQKVDARVAWFAWGPPFTPRNADSLVRLACNATPDATAFELCKTRRGNRVPAIRISPRESDLPKFGVWVQARQHAWESGSSWVCHGLVEWLVSDDPRADRLRSKATVSAIPIMDVDSVIIGAGGKDQMPHDHNRDWTDKPHWPAVAAAMKKLRQMDDMRQLDLFIDLHNPAATTTRPFYYISPRSLLGAHRERNLDRFLASTRVEMTGPLPFVGETRESGANYDKQWRAISKNWVTHNTNGHVVAVTLETAWNTENSTTAGYRAVGRQLGLSIERYLRFDSRQKPNKN